MRKNKTKHKLNGYDDRLRSKVRKREEGSWEPQRKRRRNKNNGIVWT